MKLSRNESKLIDLLKQKGFLRENIAEVISILKNEEDIEYIIDWIIQNPRASQDDINKEIKENFQYSNLKMTRKASFSYCKFLCFYPIYLVSFKLQSSALYYCQIKISCTAIYLHLFLFYKSFALKNLKFFSGCIIIVFS